MSGRLRRGPTQRSSTTPICSPGGDGTGRWLRRSFSTIQSVASLSLCALDSVAFATNIIVFIEGSTKPIWLASHSRRSHRECASGLRLRS